MEYPAKKWHLEMTTVSLLQEQCCGEATGLNSEAAYHFQRISAVYAREEVLLGQPLKRNIIFSNELRAWCARRDSNPHDVTHCHLKAARLPIPPRALLSGTAWPDRINGAM